MTSYERHLFSLMNLETVWTEASLPGVVIDTDPASENYGKPCLTVGGPIGPVLAPMWGSAALPATSWSKPQLPSTGWSKPSLPSTEWKKVNI